MEGKKAQYDAANKEIAILCNHQKGVSKGHDNQMDKLREKLEAMQQQYEELKQEDTPKARQKMGKLEQRIQKHKCGDFASGSKGDSLDSYRRASHRAGSRWR